MQEKGYFETHPHYSHDFKPGEDSSEESLDKLLLSMDYDADVFFPVAYSEALERSVKRTEAYWLPRMFALPPGGKAIDIGCGYGRSLQWLSEVYEEVHGVDISAEVLKAAAQKLNARQNVKLLVSPPDKLPDALTRGYFDFAYAFTVFQHIPREYTESILLDTFSILRPEGKVAFNLLSGVNETINEGEFETEWAIGYSIEQAKSLVEKANFNLEKLVRWSGKGSDMSWIWILASKHN